ncbi:MAG: hypothetical protein NZ838_09260, partial [Candidatus Marinimicrobia bacterium]|nr:hypothetical protein [Candidatus Neomarinimicrobiota bacterium]
FQKRVGKKQSKHYVWRKHYDAIAFNYDPIYRSYPIYSFSGNFKRSKDPENFFVRPNHKSKTGDIRNGLVQRQPLPFTGKPGRVSVYDPKESNSGCSAVK